MFQKGNKLARGGRRAGAGRKPSAIRAACAASFDERIRILTGIADDAGAPARDRLAAIGMLARYGLGHKDEADAGGPTVHVVKMSPELEKWAQ